MWARTYSKTFTTIKKERVWELWSDVNNRHLWDLDSEYCQTEGPFQAGTSFILKPQGGSRVKIEIIETTPYQSFTDRTRFFGAIMDGIHYMEQTKKGLKITTTIQISGPLSFLWRKLLVENIVRTLPQQTEALVALALKKL